MSNTLENPTPQGSINDMNSLAYDLTLVIGSVMLVLIITVATCICNRANRQDIDAYIIGGRVLSMELGSLEEGINEEALGRYPKLLYSRMKVNNKDDGGFLSTTFASTCSICLGDYKESDTLRLLPDCGHFFHVKCVDPWLRLHSTCPICRKTPHPPPPPPPSISIPVP